MKKYMKIIKDNELISATGVIEGNQIEVKDKKFNDFVSSFYNEVKIEKFNMDDIKKFKTLDFSFKKENKEAIHSQKEKLFSIYGYARRKDDNKYKNNMRYYFSIELMPIQNLFFEMALFYFECIKKNNITMKDYNIVVEQFYVERPMEEYKKNGK